MVHRGRLPRPHRPGRGALTGTGQRRPVHPWGPHRRHAHAIGQTLYVTEGQGLVQSRGGPVEDIRAGDILSTPPGEWHWHGAAPDHFMTHLSITEAPGDDRPEADWGEHVTDHEYAAAPATGS
jgi:quercetin dioxygenase-like cupin family protein